MNDLVYFANGEVAFEVSSKEIDGQKRYYRYNRRKKKLEYTDDDVKAIRRVKDIKWNISDIDVVTFMDEMREQRSCWRLIDLILK